MTITTRAALVVTALAVIHIYLGAGYLIGPERFTSSGTLRYAAAALSQQTWGALFLAGGLLTFLAPHLDRVSSTVLHVLAAAPFAVFAALVAVADLTGQAQGWGGTLLFALPVWLHVRLLLARHRWERAR